MKSINSTLKFARTALLAGGLVIGAWACGDDGGDGGGAGTGTAGTGTAGTGTAGTGTAGTGTAGTGGSMPIMCGTATCMQVGMLPPCCAEGDVCGGMVPMVNQCVALMQPGDLDPSCPTERSVVMTDLPGCCKPDGKCGVQSATFMGCIERTAYPSLLVEGMTALEEMPCGGGADGGM